jgi:hypothetical protein
MAIEREVLDWGVRISARPFTGKHEAMVIKSEIAAVDFDFALLFECFPGAGN